jgi:hypothetical protein
MSDHQPIQPETSEIMNALAQAIDKALNGKELTNRKWGFALLVYPFGEAPHQDRMNYIGSGARANVLVALKELVARWEGRYAETETKQ